MKLTKMHDDVTKIESGNWIITFSGDDGFAVNKNTAEFLNFDRRDIDDLVNGLKETKHEMVMNHHG